MQLAQGQRATPQRIQTVEPATKMQRSGQLALQKVESFESATLRYDCNSSDLGPLKHPETLVMDVALSNEFRFHESNSQLLVVRFRLPDGNVRSVSFTMQPLGLEFKKSSPTFVKNVHAGTHADALGLKPGWEVISIDGDDVTGCGHGRMYLLLHEGSSRLRSAQDMDPRLRGPPHFPLAVRLRGFGATQPLGTQPAMPPASPHTPRIRD